MIESAISKALVIMPYTGYPATRIIFNPGGNNMRTKSFLKMLLITSVSLFVFIAGVFLLRPQLGTGNGKLSFYPVTVHAGEAKTATASLNMRSGPGTGYTVILVIPKGAVVNVTGYSGSFAQIDYNGKSGYAHNDYLKGPEGAAVVRYTTTDLNMREGPGTGYSVILVIKKGSEVKVESASGGWVRITHNGKAGYVSAAYLSDKGGGSPSPSHVYTTTAKLNLRSGPGTGYGVLLMIPQETPLTVLGSASGWYRVTYGGRTGYVSGSYVSVSDTKAAAEAYVNGKGLSSSTGYLIWVNTKTFHTYVFSGKAGSWKMIKDMLSTVGKDTTPTIKGTFTLKAKGTYFTVDGHEDWICRYYSQFYNDYLIHSVVYDKAGNLIDGRLGMKLSRGCVRVSLENAKYIFDSIPKTTRIFVS